MQGTYGTNRHTVEHTWKLQWSKYISVLHTKTSGYWNVLFSTADNTVEKKCLWLLW